MIRDEQLHRGPNAAVGRGGAIRATSAQGWLSCSTIRAHARSDDEPTTSLSMLVGGAAIGIRDYLPLDHGAVSVSVGHPSSGAAMADGRIS